MSAASENPAADRLPGPDDVDEADLADDARGPGGPAPGVDPSSAAGDDGSAMAAAADAEADASAAAATPGEEAAIDVDAAAVDVSEDLDELAVAHAERDSYLDALRRLQADFENYKKRMVKQQMDQADRAAEFLVEKLLPVLDTADLAYSHGAGEDLTQVRTALLDVLAREGLDRIDPDGGPFDPTVHDGVAHEPGDGDQEVAEVLRAGYWWKGRVLRPAMVKVRG
ncbi:MAG: nucleotide exchange factor GrpE [Actinomycetota bacterium]|nr:nucleotide exchange factor GrpE [Actinomycetota bacterium]